MKKGKKKKRKRTWSRKKRMPIINKEIPNRNPQAFVNEVAESPVPNLFLPRKLLERLRISDRTNLIENPHEGRAYL